MQRRFGGTQSLQMSLLAGVLAVSPPAHPPNMKIRGGRNVPHTPSRSFSDSLYIILKANPHCAIDARRA